MDTAPDRTGSPNIRRVLTAAWPVMLGYVAIGVPCGILCNQVGLAPWMCFFMSCTFYSGAGQFMLPGLWMAGGTIPSIVASIAFVNTRQLLYSASFARYFMDANPLLAFAFSATVTDESFGVNIDRFNSDASWKHTEATLVNIACMLTWAASNTLGALVGSVIDIPTDIAAFAMTSIFICLLVMQHFNNVTFVTVGVAFVGVYLSKLLNLGGASVLTGALLGIATGLYMQRRKP